LDSVNGGGATGTGAFGVGTIVSDDPSILDVTLTANTNQAKQLGMFTFNNGENSFTSLVLFDEEGQQNPTAVKLGFQIDYSVPTSTSLLYLDTFKSDGSTGTSGLKKALQIKDMQLGEAGANVDIIDENDGVNIGVDGPAQHTQTSAAVDMNDPNTTSDSFGLIGDWAFTDPADTNDRVAYNGPVGPAQDGGGGIDILEVVDVNIDLAALSDAKLENFEVIALTGTAAQNVTLSAADVLEVTDGQNVLHVVGGPTDSVNLSGGGWTVVGGDVDAASGIQGAATYFGWVQVTHSSGALLLVDQQMTINVV